MCAHISEIQSASHADAPGRGEAEASPDLTARDVRSARLQQIWAGFTLCPDEATFALLYDETKNFVFTIAMRVLGREDDAVDVLQSVYAELMELAMDPERAEAVSDINDLVRRLTLRESDTLRKRQQRRRERDAGPVALELLEDKAPPADQVAMDNELREHLARGLQALPEEYRLPLVLHYFQGLSHQEIAEALGMSRSAVTKQIHKALHRLEGVIRRAGVTESVLPSLLLALALHSWLQPPATCTAAKVFAAAKARLAIPPPTPSFAGQVLGTARRSPALTAGATAAVFAAAVAWFLAPPPPSAPVQPPPPATRISKPAFPGNLPRPHVPAPSPAPLRLAPVAKLEAGQIHGRVVTQSTAEPLAGVSVQLVPEAPDAPPASFVSAADGRFAYHTVGPGKYHLHFSPPPPYAGFERPIHLREGESLDLGDIDLRRPGTIRGRVLSGADGSPMPGEPVDLGNTIDRKLVRQLSDSEGRFEFVDLPHHKYALMIQKRSAHYKVVLLPENQTREVDLVIGPGELTGSVYRAGAPVVKPTVRAYLDTGDEYETRGAVGRPDGQFTLKNLVPGRWRLRISTGEPHLVRQEAVVYADVFATGSETISAVIPSGILEGSVTDLTGAPVSGAEIRITQAAKPPLTENLAEKEKLEQLARFDLKTSSGETGRFRMEGLPPGACFVVATHPGAGTAMMQVQVPFNGVTAGVVLPLNPGHTGTITARASDLESGKNVAGIWCDLLTTEGKSLGWPRQESADGGSLLSGVPPGEYLVEISANGYSSVRKPVRIEGAATIHLDEVLHETGALDWRLISADGTPTSGVYCLLERADVQEHAPEDLREGRTGANGIWTVRGLRPGLWRLTAEVGGVVVDETVRIHARNLSEKRTRIGGEN